MRSKNRLFDFAISRDQSVAPTEISASHCRAIDWPIKSLIRKEKMISGRRTLASLEVNL